jgi:hypothetical protein
MENEITLINECRESLKAGNYNKKKSIKNKT